MSKKVYLNHDGGVDDLISLFLLLQMEDVELVGVGVIPANPYIESALFATEKIINRFGHGITVEVAKSNSKGKNPFPKDWHVDVFYVDALPILNEFDITKPMIIERPAHLHLVDNLRNSQEKITLIFTGPLSDLARALDEAPDIEEKIEKLIWMGGTFSDKGNVEETRHNGTAEWNAFWDPDATARVWESSIEIDLVALESINKVPLTTEIRASWAKNRQDFGIEFLGQCYAIIPKLLRNNESSTYFLGEVLTTLTVFDTKLVKRKEVPSIVHIDGPNQGRTETISNGRTVNLIYDVERETLFDYIVDLARQE
ncbi:nucleoside hydrolase [Rummeliibacillus sp. NPDC094406]|uniref:nucleoside hydrolase n=1 Tax=Rummeliibacillus sp. NPDC094406 TaxID=3364511 RepID=UPI00382F12B7